MKQQGRGKVVLGLDGNFRHVGIWKLRLLSLVPDADKIYLIQNVYNNHLIWGLAEL